MYMKIGILLDDSQTHTPLLMSRIVYIKVYPSDSEGAQVKRSVIQALHVKYRSKLKNSCDK